MRIGRALRVAADELAEVLWPTRCVGCEQPGELLCEECRAGLPWIEQRLACPVCGAPFGFLACTECGGGTTRTPDPSLAWPARATVAALGFSGTPARVVTALKDAHELRLSPVMAAIMLTALEEASAWPAADGAPRFSPGETDAVCFVPATSAAYVRRGFDHMELVSSELAREAGLQLADVLVRRAARDQRELGRSERAANLAGTVRVAGDVSGARLLLVDDVATTGASLAEATRALRARGAASVTACVLARVW
ncbi:ComF family protein [Olsenella profusa]|uniref:ComF family protein n=1 Tax=Olsenella profusa TaxID=138595 RepID=A0ABS2F361_9ACTN|nr:phosphoribosyltransferase family protein [Olsenella profusa]MBM6774979.1 ComF family protein [Olsenella profusa]